MLSWRKYMLQTNSWSGHGINSFWDINLIVYNLLMKYIINNIKIKIKVHFTKRSGCDVAQWIYKPNAFICACFFHVLANLQLTSLQKHRQCLGVHKLLASLWCGGFLWNRRQSVKVHILHKDVNNEIKGGSVHTSFKMLNPSLWRVTQGVHFRKEGFGFMDTRATDVLAYIDPVWIFLIYWLTFCVFLNTSSAKSPSHTMC